MVPQSIAEMLLSAKCCLFKVMVLVSPLDFDSLIDPEHAWKKSTDKFLESIGARVSNKSNKSGKRLWHSG